MYADLRYEGPERLFHPVTFQEVFQESGRSHQKAGEDRSDCQDSKWPSHDGRRFQAASAMRLIRRRRPMFAFMFMALVSFSFMTMVMISLLRDFLDSPER